MIHYTSEKEIQMELKPESEYRFKRGEWVEINLGHGFKTLVRLRARDYTKGNPATWLCDMACQAQVHEDDMMEIPKPLQSMIC